MWRRILERSPLAGTRKVRRSQTASGRRTHTDAEDVSAQTQGYNIRRYSDYLISRARAFEKTKTDYVRSGQGRMRRLTVEKGLLRETEIVQRQIRALLKCDVCFPGAVAIPGITTDRS